MNSEDEHATTNGGAVHVSTEILLWCDSNCNSDVKKMDAYTMLFKAEDIHVGDFETSFNHAPPKLKDIVPIGQDCIPTPS